MLVLTRRTGEAIVIGDGIKLTVMSIGPGRVKIGIEAPTTVRIDREEIHERIRQEETSTDVASDVLDGVSADVASQSDQATMIVSGPDTGILKSGESTRSTASNAATKPRLSEFRAHRKPR
jgi:carbon storage regulator